ncbi:toxin-antitoxin system YwqK family antitoxin [Flavobacteriaceae bacterium M23B6Z8]
MKKFMYFLLLTSTISCAQKTETTQSPEENMVAMSDTYTRSSSDSSVRYYQKGSDKPFTGLLYARYDNGELQSVQQFVDGVGNGTWTNYDPDGRKESEGTYKDNRVEGPVTFFYENGSIKAKGQYVHWKNPIGWWIFYDRQGNIVSKRRYTR